MSEWYFISQATVVCLYSKQLVEAISKILEKCLLLYQLYHFGLSSFIANLCPAIADVFVNTKSRLSKVVASNSNVRSRVFWPT